MFSFVNPWMLWGLVAAGVPVLIHLLLRPRPRTVRFPALALMAAALTSGQRASRVQNLLLLVVRMGVLSLAAILLAGPTCAERSAGARVTGPIAEVLVLDDSLSMEYRPRFDRPDTALDLAREQALAHLAETSGRPIGSRLAVVRARADAADAELSDDRVALAQALRKRFRDAPHARPLGSALRAAAQLLQATDLPSRHLTVFTDGTASAWRDVRPAMLTGIDRLRVTVVAAIAADRSNLAITAARSPTRVWPANTRVPLQVEVAGEGIAGEGWLVARRGDEVVARVGPLQLTDPYQRLIRLDLPPEAAGSHSVTVVLEPEDLLRFDQQRYVVWQTGARPTVWLVVPSRDAVDEDLSVLIFRNLLAPELLPADEQRVAIEVLDASALAQRLAERGSADDDWRRPMLVMVFPDVMMSDESRTALLELVEAGTQVLLVPVSAAGDTVDWPGLRAELGDSLMMTEQLNTPTQMRWEPIAETWWDAALDEITRCAVQQRLLAEALGDSTEVLARYRDDMPAIVGRRRGAGRLLLLTTAPDPAWSDLGVQAAGLLTWLYALVDDALGPPTAVANFVAGEQVDRVFPVLPASGMVRITAEGEYAGRSDWQRLREGLPPERWPTDVAGIYTVASAGGAQRLAKYAVNWPAEESDLTPITEQGLEQALGVPDVRFERPTVEEVTQAQGWWRRWWGLSDPAGALGLMLLGLFVWEGWLAGRRGLGKKNEPATPIRDVAGSEGGHDSFHPK